MTVHHLDAVRGTVHGRFNRSLPPPIEIDPGDTVIYRTIDAGWGRGSQRIQGEPPPDVGRDAELDLGHALTGPISVRGAQAGDVLEVEIKTLRPGRWGWTWAGPMTHLARPYTDLGEETTIGWHLDPNTGMATDAEGRGISVPLHPFMGVMGNAPAEAGDHSTAPPRRVGGNLDCRELVSGSTLWLPIEVDGALFSVGDGHGTQGDGEISGTAIECPMEHVELAFQVRRDMRLSMPRARTLAGIVTFGLGDSLDDAAKQAISGMLDYLEETLSVTRPEAAVLASLTVHLRVTQVVNGVVGVHGLLPPEAFHITSAGSAQ
ncbi:MAG TPA: acetamidase/formamidase family protein [Chloroflexota bacterium]